MTTVISVENLSKSYRLGQINTGTFSRDLEAWWARLRGKPNPHLRIGETDHGNRDGEEIWALRDVSFTVEQGEVLGIIGRNGAGKSTLLKILSRVTAPTSGKIKVKGRVASLLEVGTGFHPELTGRENIYLNGAILGMTKAEVTRKFDEIVDFAGVEKFIDTPVKRYSSGMYVRLAFAVAAHLDPEILVVDEVLAVGDAEFQKKCLGKMGEVAQGGRTVLFVSHNMAAISSLCSRVIFLADGKFKTHGKPMDVISTYQAVVSSVFFDDFKKIAVRPSVPSISRACIVNMKGEPIVQVNMGEPFGIQVEFLSPDLVRNPVLGIRINNELGVTIFGTNNLIQHSQILCQAARTGVFRVTFPEPVLNQGVYSVSLMLTDAKVNYSRLIDALKFTVLEKDIYGTGKVPSSEQSITIMPGVWEFFQYSNLVEWPRETI